MIALTANQYAILIALSSGGPYTLWPMTRRFLLRARLIRPNGPRPAPSDTRRTHQPRREYALTGAGIQAIAAFTGSPAVPRSVGFKPAIARTRAR